MISLPLKITRFAAGDGRIVKAPSQANGDNTLEGCGSSRDDGGSEDKRDLCVLRTTRPEGEAKKSFPGGRKSLCTGSVAQ